MASQASVKVPGVSKAASAPAWKGYAKGIAQIKSANLGSSGPITVPKPNGPGSVLSAVPKLAPAPAPAASTTAPATAPISNSTPLDLAGLTGDQQQAFINAWSKYQGSLTTLGQQAAGVQTTRDQSTAAENKGYTANTETENANAAARGLFQSSIRDGDLNDLDATHIANMNNIGANYTSAINAINAQVGGLNTDWGAEQGLMDWYRIQNSQAAPPPVNTPSPAPAAPAAPVPAAPAKSGGSQSVPVWKGYQNDQRAAGSRGGLIGVAKARM